MKVKQLIKIAEAITGKLPADMYELDEVDHHSIHRDEPIRIADMDVVHLVRAFRHQERMLNRQVGANLISKLARERDMWKEKAMNMVEKSTHEELKLENARLVDRLERDDHGVGEIERQRDDAIFDLKQERNRAMMYAEMLNDNCPNGHAYVFSEIPNDDEGREFVQKMKGYLNKESYKLRVKGQYLDEETKRTEGWKVHQYGQPISKSKCLRVYVDVKKDNQNVS